MIADKLISSRLVAGANLFVDGLDGQHYRNQNHRVFAIGELHCDFSVDDAALQK